MAKLNFRRAEQKDLPIIVKIYNQAVEHKIATDDDHPVTVADRQEWLDESDDHFPIWVIEDAGTIVGWVALEEFFHHPNYAHDAQIAIYFDYRHHQQSLGTRTLAFIDDQVEHHLPLTTIVSYIFEENIASQKLFTKCGYKFVGDLPTIAHINGKYRTIKTYLKHFDVPIIKNN